MASAQSCVMYKKRFALIEMNSETAMTVSRGFMYANWRDAGTRISYGAAMGDLAAQGFYANILLNLNLSLVNENWNGAAGPVESFLFSADRAFLQTNWTPDPW